MLFSKLFRGFCQMSEDIIYNTLKKKSRQALLGELMGGICHEINNPLTILIGNLGILQKFLKKDPLPPIERLLAFSVEIDSSSKRIQNIVSTLRFVGKADMIEDSTEESVDDLLDQTQILLKTRINREKIEFNIENFPCKRKIKCRQGLIIEALTQILLNRIEALEGTINKTISLKIVIEDKKIQLLITDSSKKMKNEDLYLFQETCSSKIIHPDFRLAIAQDAIKQDGGNLELVNEGSCYSLLVTLNDLLELA